MPDLRKTIEKMVNNYGFRLLDNYSLDGVTIRCVTCGTNISTSGTASYTPTEMLDGISKLCTEHRKNK